ncbi:hypothetical protein MUK42_13602, partial [Musa troglodytarum]
TKQKENTTPPGNLIALRLRMFLEIINLLLPERAERSKSGSQSSRCGETRPPSDPSELRGVPPKSGVLEAELGLRRHDFRQDRSFVARFARDRGSFVLPRDACFPCTEGGSGFFVVVWPCGL